MGPRAGLDCGEKCRARRNSIPGPTNACQAADDNIDATRNSLLIVHKLRVRLAVNQLFVYKTAVILIHSRVFISSFTQNECAKTANVPRHDAVWLSECLHRARMKEQKSVAGFFNVHSKMGLSAVQK